MPEGHVIHRLADELTAVFEGHEVSVSSPQGRFAVESVHLDGTVLRGAEAWGKHLFIDFAAPEAHWVHIHLGLIGRLTVGPVTPVHGQVRLRIENSTSVADLRGPQWCRLLTDDERRAVLATVGADPIRDDADPERAWRAVHRSSRSVAALLMDQSIAAGVGNIYRAEVLFRARLDPTTPGNRLSHATWTRIWADLVDLMRLGVANGRIDTVAAEHTPEAMGRPPRVDRHGGEVYVYRRAGQPCLVCGAPVRQTDLGGRHLFWCPRCQRRHR
ncbi:Fpg/Nei family DNA glycosylase [Acidipropionibacterium virtanenii]|uniref:DNA-(apurinic or apyrimidinic site) lyase n=1 Tax=Acidipropionibacterium virtanenii TaxID=2057246 RepID=A0A344USX5_9ACTN|nr:DNA-formamidopyrimidine glycosylase family protein [Acidipropionibacterium virtanenii]AXE38373.1 Endonuclease 8 1 [Acidipropionibacterium virtanenii]